MKNWPQTVAELTAQLRNLRGDVPEVMKAFGNIAQAALAPKALDSKTKELIALGISVARVRPHQKKNPGTLPGVVLALAASYFVQLRQVSVSRCNFYGHKIQHD